MINENIVHVKVVEGLLIQAQEHIGKIEPIYSALGAAIEQAKEEINDIQTNIIHTLRTLSEGESNE